MAMKIIKKITVVGLGIILVAGCAKVKTPEAQLEREQWIAGFSDSVEYYKNRTEEIDSRLKELKTRIDKELENFEHINNPREVTGYYLLKGWNKKIPLTSTGIYARLNQNEQIELIATLSGSTFNRIGVGTGNSEIYSETVPHDQALNYRHRLYNTVYFSGGKADTITEYIAKHHSDKITLEFLENSTKKKFIIPEDEKEMINVTWQLFDLQRQAHVLQKELWICSRKIDTFRRFQEQEEAKSIKK